MHDAYKSVRTKYTEYTVLCMVITKYRNGFDWRFFTHEQNQERFAVCIYCEGSYNKKCFFEKNRIDKKISQRKKQWNLMNCVLCRYKTVQWEIDSYIFHHHLLTLISLLMNVHKMMHLFVNFA